jgi:protein-arginine kinase activator protein McsA
VLAPSHIPSIAETNSVMAPKVKGKATASQQPPPPIEDLFSNLSRHIERSEFEQAVKVADQGIYSP